MKTKSIFITATLTLVFSQALAGGNNAPSFTAVVDSNGTLVRGLHASSVNHFSKGVYAVDFTEDVTACGYTATIGLSGSEGASDPGTVTVVGLSKDANGLYIQTFDAKGKRADMGFHVIVAC